VGKAFLASSTNYANVPQSNVFYQYLLRFLSRRLQSITTRFLDSCLPFAYPKRAEVMTITKLSKTSIEALTPKRSDYVVWDSVQPGFGVRVRPTGVKSYVVQYRNRRTGESRRKTLGQHGPLLTLHKARARARILLAEALKGLDPVAEAQAARAAPTLRAFSEEYLTEYAIPRKRPRSVADDKAMLDRLILPKLGSRRVADISPRDVQSLHNGLKKTPYQANRVIALLSKIFNLAIRSGIRHDNPVKGVERFQEERRDTWLTEQELARLFEALANHSNQKAANAARLQILTGARIGEVLSARWEDFNFERGVWTKPTHHTKQKKREHVPLSSAAMSLLAEMHDQTNRSQSLLFPGRDEGEPLGEIRRFWREIRLAAGLEGYRMHDNRHTFASHLVSEGLSLEIVGRLLGHTNPLTTKRYAHLADSPLRAAAESFSKRLPKS
jgi:integrase